MAKKDEPEFIRHGLDGEHEVVAAPAKKQSLRAVRAAVNMKIAGASYAEIAQTLEYASPAAARQVVEQGLADAYETKDTASLRRITEQRLEGLWQLSWRKAQETRPKRDEWGDEIPGEVENNPEQASFIRLGLDVAGRIAKLRGLDAPTQLQISPGAEELNETVAMLVATTRKGLPAEADIFAEVIEDTVEVGPEDTPDA